MLRKSCTYIVQWRKKYNLVQILCIYCTSRREVQSCANLAHILRIGERSTVLRKSCTYIAHWRNDYSLVHILHIGERSTILHKSCAMEKEVQSCTYIAHWRKKYNLGKSCALEKEVQSCAYIAHWRNNYNLAHILHIGEITTILQKSCAYLADILHINNYNNYNLAQILRIYCTL